MRNLLALPASPCDCTPLQGAAPSEAHERTGDTCFRLDLFKQMRSVDQLTPAVQAKTLARFHLGALHSLPASFRDLSRIKHFKLSNAQQFK